MSGNRSKNHSLTLSEMTVECGRLDFAEDSWSFDRQGSRVSFWLWHDGWQPRKGRDVPKHVREAVRLLNKYRVTAGKGK